jgi:hypothetical protein
MWTAPWSQISTNTLGFEVQSQRMKEKQKISMSQGLGSDMKVSATGLSTNSWEFEIESQSVNFFLKFQLMWAKPWAQISTNRLRFEVQAQRIKEKIKISTHVSQALSFDLKASATRPSTNSLKFEVQSQRMKRKIQISTHVSQALGSDINN